MEFRTSALAHMVRLAALHILPDFLTLNLKFFPFNSCTSFCIYKFEAVPHFYLNFEIFNLLALTRRINLERMVFSIKDLIEKRPHMAFSIYTIFSQSFNC